uniref:Secreted protein n=1 Tax=Opuntia streptacantha TaxID=393608 RepID=A0A7C9CLK9_OPUST
MSICLMGAWVTCCIAQREDCWTGQQGIRLPLMLRRVCHTCTMTLSLQLCIEISSPITSCWMGNLELRWRISGWPRWWRIPEKELNRCQSLPVHVATSLLSMHIHFE